MSYQYDEFSKLINSKKFPTKSTEIFSFNPQRYLEHILESAIITPQKHSVEELFEMENKNYGLREFQINNYLIGSKTQVLPGPSQIYGIETKHGLTIIKNIGDNFKSNQIQIIGFNKVDKNDKLTSLTYIGAVQIEDIMAEGKIPAKFKVLYYGFEYDSDIDSQTGDLTTSKVANLISESVVLYIKQMSLIYQPEINIFNKIK